MNARSCLGRVFLGRRNCHILDLESEGSSRQPAHVQTHVDKSKESCVPEPIPMPETVIEAEPSAEGQFRSFEGPSLHVLQVLNNFPDKALFSKPVGLTATMCDPRQKFIEEWTFTGRQF